MRTKVKWPTVDPMVEYLISSFDEDEWKALCEEFGMPNSRKSRYPIARKLAQKAKEEI